MDKKRIEYCPFCNSFEECEVETVDYEADVRGTKFDCVKHIATCKRCHEEIYVKELFDQDLACSLEKYKKLVGLLTAEEIRAFRKAYGMSATELSSALGLGAKTITRIENGDIQSRSTDRAIRLYIRVTESMGTTDEKSWAPLCSFAQQRYKIRIFSPTFDIEDIVFENINNNVGEGCVRATSKQSIMPYA